MHHFSLLDLSPIPEGGTASDALHNTLDLARLAEEKGYHRFWLAEHHNMPGIASAATSVVIGHVASGTRTIRVGAGGIHGLAHGVEHRLAEMLVAPFTGSDPTDQVGSIGDRLLAVQRAL